MLPFVAGGSAVGNHQTAPCGQVWSAASGQNGRMADTTQRVLRLLGLLEARTTWQAHELAERLGVTERTVRRDVTRLRELGYPVESERGVEGGYRLGVGRRLPPLLLDDDEAVAMVACLRMAALAGSDDVGEAALRSLTKLEQVLPPRLRAVAAAVDTATSAIPHSRPAVDLQALQELALAQRDHRLVRFDYVKPSGEQGPRLVEPGRLMTQGERWYLQAFDRDREDWRLFRLDRMSGIHATTFRCAPRPVPPHGLERTMTERFPCVLEVQTDVGAERVAERIPAAYREDLVATRAGCRFTVGGFGWEDLAWHLLWACRDLDARLTVPDGPEGARLRDAMDGIAAWAGQVVTDG